MAVAQGYGKTVTSGSVFAYDVADTRNSYIGRPTVNVSAGLGLTNYNNVPGNVNTSITATGGTYKGAAIYQQTITPLDATGVSYLTNGNNPGIGVYHGGGGGTGGQYSGHTIFFKPVGPMYSSPIFTHYSNIGGWQSTSNYEDMGDGWFRANVLWYNASTLSDQKFWAINPSGATANVPITIYWAGPFKENLNSTTISQFVEGTRSATQGLLPIVGNSTLDLSNVSFDSNAQMTFDGTDDRVDTSITNVVNNASYEAILYCRGNVSTYNMYMGQYLPYIGVYGGNTIYYSDYINGGQTVLQTNSGTISYNTYYHVVCMREYDGTNTIKRIYINGNLMASTTVSGAKSAFVNPNTVTVGDGAAFTWYPFYGEIPVAKIYNRALSAAEVRQNYLHYKTRFNLS